jgi:hypothetical protein
VVDIRGADGAGVREIMGVGVPGIIYEKEKIQGI